MKIDHIHFYVEDANASRDWFVGSMGFHPLSASESPHTRTVVVQSGSVYIHLSSPITSVSPVAQFLKQHPPGVADIAFVVSDLEGVLARAVASGAKLLEPVGEHGGWRWGKIAAWGSLSHTLCERTEAFLAPSLSDRPYNTAAIASDLGVPTAALSPTPSSPAASKCGLFSSIDHIVLNVAAGDLEPALSWYETVFGFQRQRAFSIQTEQSALRSQVMIHPVSGVQFPINEPASANSQIQEFLEANRGPGIQHIALQTPGIIKAIAKLRQLGLSFLPVPSTYYTQLQQQHQGLHLSAAALAEIAAQEILVDWHEQSPQALLLQIFTQPIFKAPTFFFELIERRHQAKGFGEGNFRALFEAIEREQMKRGTFPMPHSPL